MKVLEPIRIGKMELKNRVVALPTGTNLCSAEGHVTEREKNYWVARAKGGAGLIEIGAASFAGGQLGLEGAIGLIIDDDSFIPGLREVAEAVKAEGAKVSAQLMHGGRHCQEGLTHTPTVAFSIPTYPSAWSKDELKILTVEEIDDLAEAFAEAARRIRDAGFDAVDFHAAHNWLIHQSMSPLDNKRTDKYGGDFERRLRFSVEILERTKKKIGDDLAIIWRVSGEEQLAGGFSLDDMKKMVPTFERAGADIISVSTGGPGYYFIPASLCWPRGPLLPLAEGIKQVAKVPVLAVGRIDNLWQASKIIEEGKADLTGMCRALICDPELPKKTIEGRIDDIIPCLACSECMQRVSSGFDIHCVVNPTVGREEEARITPAEKSKKVIIAGGGPAGMEAAMIAKLRGHDVVLYEKSDRLGGQLLLASKGAYKQEFDNLTWYFITQITKLGIRVELQQEVTPALVRELRPDVVIVATGATPLIPDIPGVDLDNVVIANDVLSGAAVVTGRRAVVIGGGFVGVETAEFLLDRGKEVTMVVRRRRLGTNVLAIIRPFIEKRMRDKGLKVIASANVEEITAKGIVVTTDGERQVLDADTVVLARGAESCKELAKQLEGQVAELYTIGDCVEPRKAIEAIYEGWRVASTI